MVGKSHNPLAVENFFAHYSRDEDQCKRRVVDFRNSGAESLLANVTALKSFPYERPSSNIFTDSTSHSSAPSVYSADPKLANTAPPDPTDPLGGPVVLFCEFVGLGACDVTFQSDEFWPWVEHIEKVHLQGLLPARSRCWYCDDIRFNAPKSSDDRRKSFYARMEHIHRHIVDGGCTVEQMRPDFDLLKHLHWHGLIDEVVYRWALQYEEGPTAPGTYAYDFIPLEQREAFQRDQMIEVKEECEERRARRAHWRQNRPSKGKEIELPYRHEARPQKVKETQLRQLDTGWTENDKPTTNPPGLEDQSQLPLMSQSSRAPTMTYPIMSGQPEDDAVCGNQPSTTVSTESDSLSDLSEEDPLPEDHPFQSQVHPIRQAALSEFLSRIKQAGASGQRQAESGPSLTTSRNHGGQVSRRPNLSRKRLRGGNSGDRDDQGEDRKGKRPKEDHPDAEEDGPTLACPFYKRNQVRHSSCLHFRLKRIKDVKQHLQRKHVQPYYCPICGLQFEMQENLDGHLVARSCKFANVTKPEGVSPDQKTKLSRRVSKTLTESQQWFTIWDILFPNVPRPASPLVESPIHEVLSSFRGFWDERGQEIVSEHLQRDREIPYSMPREERDLGALYAMAFHQIMGALVDGFIRRFVDDSTSGSGQSVPTPPSHDDDDTGRAGTAEMSTAASSSREEEPGGARSHEEPAARGGTGHRPREYPTASLARGLALSDFFDHSAPAPYFLPSAAATPNASSDFFVGPSEPAQLPDTGAGDRVAPIDWQNFDWWTHSLADDSAEGPGNENLLDATKS